MSTSSHRSIRSSKVNRGLPAAKAGFTLIELLVVMTIMVVISALILVKQSQFDSSTLMRSLAYSIAESAQQAQTYGSSVLGTTTTAANCTGGFYSGTTCYAAGYGIYFSSATPTTYVLFADLHPGSYDAATVNAEAVKIFTLGTGYTISNFCANLSSGQNQCWSGTGTGDPIENATISYLAVVFKRPNPEANFYPVQAGGSVLNLGAYTSAYIQIANSAGTAASTRSINIYSTGEIAVGATGT